MAITRCNCKVLTLLAAPWEISLEKTLIASATGAAVNVILSPSHITAGLGNVVNVAVYDVLTSTVCMLEIRAASELHM